MAVTAPQEKKSDASAAAWKGFRSGLWQTEINVRDFIQQNYDPYDGDESFLAPATPRTQAIWDTLTALFVEERKKGVLDVSQIPNFGLPAPPVAARPTVPFRDTDFWAQGVNFGVGLTW